MIIRVLFYAEENSVLDEFHFYATIYIASLLFQALYSCDAVCSSLNFFFSTMWDE